MALPAAVKPLVQVAVHLCPARVAPLQSIDAPLGSGGALKQTLSPVMASTVVPFVVVVKVGEIVVSKVVVVVALKMAATVVEIVAVEALVVVVVVALEMAATVVEVVAAEAVVVGLGTLAVKVIWLVHKINSAL